MSEGPAQAPSVAPLHQAQGLLPCRQCSALFAPKASWQRCCTTDCRRAWHKAKGAKRVRLVDLERRVADLEGRLNALTEASTARR